MSLSPPNRPRENRPRAEIASGTTSPSRGAATRMTANVSIAGYLIQRLRDYGVDDLFGIPGDYVLSFYSELERSPINVIGCTREDCAGFAADAYARIRGMGAVCVTYCVGGLSVCNSIAGAYAEKSPVVVISGAPGLNERATGALLHHMVRDFRTQLDVFEKFTIATAELTDPLTAFSEIDRVLDACDQYKRPVYIELPRDMVAVVPPVAHGYRGFVREIDANATAEAVRETYQRLSEAKNPVILAGVEMHRFRLQDELLQLAESANIPIATTMLGKSVVSERHPLFIGLYEGAIGDSQVTRIVEQSDLVLLMGAFLSDINLGIYTAKLDPNRCVYATSESLRISYHHYHNVDLKSFLVGLNESATALPKRPFTPIEGLHAAALAPDLGANEFLRTSWMISELNKRLDADTIVIADVGDALFAATELTIHERTEFLSPAYYTSMGFSIPAALGAATARKDHRIVVLVGDGAFQMTGQELSTLIRQGHSPVVILLDNHGYGTERYLHQGDWRYNEIASWDYGELMQVYGHGVAHRVRTKAEYIAALDAAWDQPNEPHLIHATLEESDASETLKKLAQRMCERV
ncbi:alpha-keto acid decarboxylase family protein [Novipirellula artificiosorum]|uniref:Indole-3-pyruvate decarboxylase n=1 Tax=Novipirellula artificiosorum TaxID=2528016 RepID=A0A5C6E1I7_9BACT|nr:thiamine pyrophosphate-dependent enzyme [Novipirellula artificiosorum]TWU42585.1 Indole-3-pyruvate decarboxylase [Novipirellula artificiosorum]